MGKWKKVELDDAFASGWDDNAFCLGIEEFDETDLKNDPKPVQDESQFPGNAKKRKKTKKLESLKEEQQNITKKSRFSERQVSISSEKKKAKSKVSNDFFDKEGSDVEDTVDLTASVTSEINTKQTLKDQSEKLSDKTIVVKDRTLIKEKLAKVTKKKNKKKKAKGGSVNEAIAHESWAEVGNRVEENVLDQETSPDKVWKDVCGVPASVLNNLQRLKFITPTEIQRKILPIAVDGKFDIIGAAETGSGKTLAYVIPAIKRILEVRSGSGQVKGPKVLIILPTRELAVQVTQHVKEVIVGVVPKISYVTIVGGLAVHKQERVLKKGAPDIIIATPGRLNQLLNGSDIEHLSLLMNVRCLILDEADRLCEAGHFKDLENILKFVYSKSKANNEELDEEELATESRKVRKKRQTLVLSATLTVANKNSALGKSISSDPTIAAIAPVLTKLTFSNPLKVVDITRSVVTAENLTEQKILCEADEKDLYLYYCLKTLPEGRKLIFANSIDHIRRLHSLFTLLQFPCRCLHAHMEQRQRLKNLEAFAKSEDSVLFCTDVASRGLDIKNVRHVLHYHLPKTYETYVHRSGRTARSGLDGTSIMLVSQPEVKLFVKILTSLNKKEDSIETIQIDAKIVKNLSSKLQVAQEIEQIEHRNQKVTKEKSWVSNLAKEMDIEFEEDEKLTEHKSTKKLGNLKMQLSQMLAMKSMDKPAVNIRNPCAYISDLN